jgi:teichuronic acid biosynthesis glycosyltransferase TuaC
LPEAAGSDRELARLRVLWTHNFDPAIPGKGSFMHATAAGLRARGVDLRLEYLGNLRSLAQVLRARAHVKRLALEYDLVHAQFGSACALATAAVKGVPKLLTIRGSDWATHDATLDFLYFHSRVAVAFTRSAVRSFDGIISVSRRIAAEVADVAPDSLIVVLPSPVDLEVFSPIDRSAAKALLGHPECGEKWILFNSLDLRNPIKRFHLAKAAFDIAQASHGNLRLRLATNLPHNRMALFVSACDLILCTSEKEGWPNCVKEALACNVPFVATDVSDLRDIAAVEPTCRVCPADAGAIAANMCAVLADERPHDLRRHVAWMSVDSISQQMVATYETVLSRYRERNAIGR